MIVHFGLTIFILLICFLFRKNRKKQKYILPISFFLIGAYWAMKYDYGLDYWNYCEIFYYDHDYPNRHGDLLFWEIMFMFDKYYHFVIFYGFLLAIGFYYIVKKYIPVNYFWFFFIIFMLHPSLCLNMSYALRTSTAACIISYGFSLFYIDKYKLTPLLLSILFAAQFHHSLYVFLLLPLFDVFCRLSNKKILYLFLILVLLIGSSYAFTIFGQVTSSIEAFESYNHYGEDRITASSVIMLVSRAIHLFPAYFIVRSIRDKDKHISKMCILSMLYYFVFFAGLDMLGRFTTTLYIYVIMASVVIARSERKFTKKIYIIAPSIIFALQRNIQFYIEMFTSYLDQPGNMLIYKTIWGITSLP